MFDANIKKTVIDDPFGVFMNITIDIMDNVNDTQYYMPGLTFILVLYVYVIIGEGKIWKYLIGVTLSGLLASIFTALFNILRDYFPLDYVLQLKWIETIFWHFNEYGYVYISFLKLQIVVPELKKKYWKYIMSITFFYNLLVRLLISAATVHGRKSSAGSHLLGFSLIPLSIIELIFMFLIIKTFIYQSNHNSIQKDVIYTMLTSSLTRMFLVGLIYFFSSCVCYFYSPPILKATKTMVFRSKSSLGLIFLMDLLFIRINIRERISTVNLNKNYNSYNNINIKVYGNENNFNEKYNTSFNNFININNSKRNDSSFYISIDNLSDKINHNNTY
eukprot:jgi/Orpsp1_1/1178849/evm.model.c7180000066934.1